MQGANVVCNFSLTLKHAWKIGIAKAYSGAIVHVFKIFLLIKVRIIVYFKLFFDSTKPTPKK